MVASGILAPHEPRAVPGHAEPRESGGSKLAGQHHHRAPHLHVVFGRNAPVERHARTFNDEQDFKDEIEDVDVGLVVGAGYYGGLLILEARYEEGLTNVATRPASESYNDRTFVGMIGIRFGRSAGKSAKPAR